MTVKTKFERKREATYQALFDAALAASVERGHAASRVDDVVERTGQTKGAFYFTSSTRSTCSATWSPTGTSGGPGGSRSPRASIRRSRSSTCSGNAAGPRARPRHPSSPSSFALGEGFGARIALSGLSADPALYDACAKLPS